MMGRTSWVAGASLRAQAGAPTWHPTATAGDGAPPVADHAPHGAVTTISVAASVAASVATLALGAAGRRRARGQRRQALHVGRTHAVVRFATGAVATLEKPDACSEAEFELDARGRSRLRYQPDGWNTWEWGAEFAPEGEKYKINYIVSGPADGTPVVLVHGFGASSYHWRYQVPALAEQGFRVYSLCLIGYGWSPRVVLYYKGEVWAAQLNDFLREVVGRPAVLVGNSVGAFASLIAASEDPTLCDGLVLLNAAGSFEQRQLGQNEGQKRLGDVVADAAEETGPVQWLLQLVVKAIAGWAFYTTKLRIQPILEWVYVNAEQVDDDLVTSIRSPADHPMALDTFGQVIQAGRRTTTSVFEALDRLPKSCQVLLIWGMQDPWMNPERASAIRAECAERGLSCDYVEVADAGHCPQDDTPEAVNAALMDWLRQKAA